MELQEMYDELAQLVEEMRQYLDEHEGDDETLSVEESETYDKMEKKATALRKKIERREKLSKVDAELRAPQGKPILNNPGEGVQKFNFSASKSKRASEEYRQSALNAIRSKFRVVSNDLSSTPDTSGGYLIPAEWDTRLIKTLEEENVMRALGTSITTSSEHKINIVATKPTAAWTAEGQAMTFGNGTFTQVTLDAHKVTIGILVTEELLADNAFDLENYIVEQFGKGIANAEENAFINGTGTGQPTGFLTTIAANTDMYITTAGNNPTADEIMDLTYKLPRPYRKNAVFLVNDSTLALLRKFKDTSQRYLWEESYQAGEPSRLMGYPIYTSAYMPTLASGNFSIAFGDFSYYNIADRGERSFQELRETYITSGLVGFLMKERCDGVLIDTSAVRAIKIK